MSEFSNQLKEARSARSLSLRGLSKLCGITVSLIHAYENDNVEPTTGNILKLSKALDTPFIIGQIEDVD